jgi:SAM-dependent methyltransferase
MSPEAYVEMAQVQETHWWFAARGDIIQAQMRALDLPPDADILEVGSGTGANLRLLASFGKVIALEMAPEAILMAQQRCRSIGSRVRLQQGRCPEDLCALDRRFDLICLFDVLEHIEEDERSLAALAGLLKPSGKLLVTVPAHGWMWGPHDVHLHHKRRYSHKSLSDSCARSGLTVTRLSHFNTLLFPLAVLGRMWERWTDRKTTATRTPPTLLNTLLKNVFASERHLLKHMRLPFGLSLLLVAEPGR